jgi:hypothetical protein
LLQSDIGNVFLEGLKMWNLPYEINIKSFISFGVTCRFEWYIYKYIYVDFSRTLISVSSRQLCSKNKGIAILRNVYTYLPKDTSSYFRRFASLRMHGTPKPLLHMTLCCVALPHYLLPSEQRNVCRWFGFCWFLISYSFSLSTNKNSESGKSLPSPASIFAWWEGKHKNVWIGFDSCI